MRQRSQITCIGLKVPKAQNYCKVIKALLDCRQLRLIRYDRFYLFNFEVVIFVRKIDKLSSPLGVSSQRIFWLLEGFLWEFRAGLWPGWPSIAFKVKIDREVMRVLHVNYEVLLHTLSLFGRYDDILGKMKLHPLCCDISIHNLHTFICKILQVLTWCNEFF